MKTLINKIAFLTVTFLSLSVGVWALEDGSVIRLESRNLQEKAVYAVVVVNGDNKEVKALTADDPYYIENMANALWYVEKSGSEFKLKNLGTEDYLTRSEKTGYSGNGNIVYLSVGGTSVTLKDDGSYYYQIKILIFNGEKMYIQYDQGVNEWRYYSKNGGNKTASLNGNATEEGAQPWDENNSLPSKDATCKEIAASDVKGDNFSAAKNDVSNIVDNIEKKDVTEAPAVSIVVDNSDTYPTGNYWKTATIQLNVNAEDWTPISFPVDVKCVTADEDLPGVGYQKYNSKERAANGKGKAWETEYITSDVDVVFTRGEAYHFATDSKTMTLEFKPVSENTLTTLENSFSYTLEGTGGSEINDNWYYIGSALFKDADMSEISMISRYDKSKREWVETEVTTVEPFDAFFVQYAGKYEMNSAETERNSAPMLVREKSVTEKYYLRIEGDNNEDQTGIFFEEEASAEGYVIGEDFLSFANKYGSSIELYTTQDGVDYSFNRRPLENGIVKVGMYIGTAGRYTISLNNISGNADEMVLFDTYEQDFARLHLGETYTFDSEKGTFDDRFAVAVTYAPDISTGNTTLSTNKLIVVDDVIEGLVVDTQLEIYDTTGRLVCSLDVVSETMLLPELNRGIYIARNATGWVKFVIR